ncbi:hypothetical protein [uncultured Pelagimonas sp.]|uniref:hypothetical protein n=1 Tax=uncultured Pelagimonas sp. TaxID=1618102 RepID=UPI00262B7341|nr:hypothetical protein [uncultured Pelagimonas sp.]
MRIKVTIVGNSHVAALRRGWDLIQDDFDVDLQFFAANSTLFGQLSLNEKKSFGMHDTTSFKPKHVDFLKSQFGKTAIDLAASDAVVVAGQGIREKDFIRNLAKFSVDNIREAEGLPLLSEDAFHDFAKAIIQKSNMFEKWANWDCSKVFLLPSPIPLDGCPEDKEIYRVWAQFSATPNRNVEFLERFHAIVAKELAEQSISLVSPPWSVLGENGLTRKEYGGNARRLDQSLNNYKNDYHHMEAEYGAVVMRHLLEQVLAETT